jgi:hypothetical protein
MIIESDTLNPLRGPIAKALRDFNSSSGDEVDDDGSVVTGRHLAGCGDEFARGIRDEMR